MYGPYSRWGFSITMFVYRSVIFLLAKWKLPIIFCCWFFGPNNYFVAFSQPKQSASCPTKRRWMTLFFFRRGSIGMDLEFSPGFFEIPWLLEKRFNSLRSVPICFIPYSNFDVDQICRSDHFFSSGLCRSANTSNLFSSGYIMRNIRVKMQDI